MDGVRTEQADGPERVEAWGCRKCKQLYKTESSARTCCAKDRPCPCGAVIEGKAYTLCRACRDRADAERKDARWAELSAKAVDWDGETMLCQWDGDEFFRDAGDIEIWLDRHEGMRLEGMRLVTTREQVPDEPDWADLFAEELWEDWDDDGRFDGLSAAWKAMIAEGHRWARWPSGTPVTVGSLKAQVREEDEDA